MKWVRSNGSELVVRDVSEPLIRLERIRGSRMPLPIINEIMTEDDARTYLQELLRGGRYARR